MRFHLNHQTSTAERLLYALITIVMVICTCCGLGGCADDEPTEYVEVCVDSNDNRVSEDMCRNGFNSDAASTYLWMYFLMSYAMPSYGGHVTRIHGTAIRPQHATFYRVPATGGYGYKPPPAQKPAKPVTVNQPPKQPAKPAAPPPVIRRK